MSSVSFEVICFNIKYIFFVVTVNYKVELYDPRSGGFMPSSPGIGMHVEVRDPDDKIILSRVYSSEGRISFTSHVPGEHVICMYSNSTAWFSGSQLRVHLDIQVGEHAIDYGNVVQKEKLTELQLRIRQLLDQVEQITKEQNYQRVRVKIVEGFLLFLSASSIVKSVLDKLAKAQTRECCGGP